MIQKHPLTAKYATLLNKFNVNTVLRLAHFLGQLETESGLKPIEENLRYTGKRLLQVFPKYFPTASLANQYAMKPQNIANRVYANRMENGNESSGDGWNYRGRGFIQLTGKRKYRLLTEWAKSKGIDADYAKNPNLLLNEADALISALWYWETNGINKYADKNDVLSVSRLVNVGRLNTTIIPHGFDDRKRNTQKYMKVFEC